MNNAMTMRAIGALLLAALPCVAGAQAMYRCGNTFSQKPCGDNAAAVKVPGTEVTSATGASTPDAVCSRAIHGGGRYRIDNVESGGTDTVAYAGQTVAAKLYRVSLTLLDENGRSMGRSAAVCYLSEDGQRVLKVER
jgi:hypothetical protein